MDISAIGASKRRVLVVEDEPDVRDLLSYNFQVAGFSVRTADNGVCCLAEWRSFAPNMILLDVTLPDISGPELCRLLRAHEGPEAQPAIVMVSDKGDESDRLFGFEVGADDYVVKPFSVRELVLRVNAILRARDRTALASVENRFVRREPYVLGNLKVDAAGGHVFACGNEIHPTAMEMRLLVYLIENAGRLCSREAILENVWNYRPGASTRTIDTHIKRLRDRLGDARTMIRTLRGAGYRLTAE